MAQGGRERRVRVAAVAADHERVVPREAEAREGDGHRRRRGPHVEPVGADARGQRAHDAVEARVAAGQHARVAVVGRERLERRLELAREGDLLGSRGSQRLEVAPAAGDQRRVREQLGARGRKRLAVDAEHGNHANASEATRSRAPGLAPTTCAPSKSTMIASTAIRSLT